MQKLTKSKPNKPIAYLQSNFPIANLENKNKKQLVKRVSKSQKTIREIYTKNKKQMMAKNIVKLNSIFIYQSFT